MSFITIKEALHELHTKKPCSIVFVSLDLKRGTGGEILEVVDVVEGGQTQSSWQNNTITVKRKGKHPYTIHIYLIIRFNGKLIVW